MHLDDIELMDILWHELHFVFTRLHAFFLNKPQLLDHDLILCFHQSQIIRPVTGVYISKNKGMNKT